MEPREMGTNESTSQRTLQGQAKEKHEPREKRPLWMKQKVFIEQRSLLDELLEVEHFRTIYNIFVAVLCIFVLRAVVVDFIDNECIVLDFEVLIFAFGRLHMALLAWLVMFLYTLLVPYKVLQIWARSLETLQLPTAVTVIAAAVLLIGHATVLGFYPVYTVISQPFGPASCFVIILEQLRFLMKIHSFLREIAPPILRARSNDGKMGLPPFSTYLYFLFCPTLIYRENYPRTPHVRWRYVIENFAKFLGCLFYGSLLFKCLSIPIFSNMNKQPLTLRRLVLSVFNATLPALYLVLLMFFCFFHCWLNAFAEMLRFADRGFYKDWWNATSFPTFFRTWNVVVHDWLYYYIYQDLLWVFKAKAQSVALLSTFIISGVVHEYAFTLCFGFFYPFTLPFSIVVVLEGMFYSTFTHGNKRPNSNILFWTYLLLGLALQFCLQSLEWYSQIHCPVQKVSILTQGVGQISCPSLLKAYITAQTFPALYV
nr:PREDICTED: sterol O-acyltransferase 2 isoform X1 [Anolis carolinensis]|eukprot:XP_016846592.1 PREDICTED: sterol O-acyltransferase 2 isoform X1 [Anolis carolinensis]